MALSLPTPRTILPQEWAQQILLLAAKLSIQDCLPEIPSPGNLDPGHSQLSAGPVMPNCGPFLVFLSVPIYSWLSFFTFAATCPATHLSTPQLPIRRGREPNPVPWEAVGEEQDGVKMSLPAPCMDGWAAPSLPAGPGAAWDPSHPARGCGEWEPQSIWKKLMDFR